MGIVTKIPSSRLTFPPEGFSVEYSVSNERFFFMRLLLETRRQAGCKQETGKR